MPVFTFDVYERNTAPGGWHERYEIEADYVADGMVEATKRFCEEHPHTGSIKVDLVPTETGGCRAR